MSEIKRNIVVIDDDDNATELLEYSFGKYGYNTVCFNDSLTASKYLKDHKVDVIITDWMMPKLNGIELVMSLQETVNKETPKMMVSCIANPESIKIALLSGVSQYLPKPVKSMELYSAIENMLLSN